MSCLPDAAYSHYPSSELSDGAMATWRQLDATVAAVRLRSGSVSGDDYDVVVIVDGDWWQMTIGCCPCSVGHYFIASCGVTAAWAQDCSPCAPVGPSPQDDSGGLMKRFQRPFWPLMESAVLKIRICPGFASSAQHS